jgi:hypothetical protein
MPAKQIKLVTKSRGNATASEELNERAIQRIRATLNRNYFDALYLGRKLVDNPVVLHPQSQRSATTKLSSNRSRGLRTCLQPLG